MLSAECPIQSTEVNAYSTRTTAERQRYSLSEPASWQLRAWRPQRPRSFSLRQAKVPAPTPTGAVIFLIAFCFFSFCDTAEPPAPIGLRACAHSPVSSASRTPLYPLFDRPATYWLAPDTVHTHIRREHCTLGGSGDFGPGPGSAARCHSRPRPQGQPPLTLTLSPFHSLTATA